MIGSKRVGLCTKRDLDLVDERHEPLSEHMTPVDQLILGREGCSLQEAQEIIKVSKKGEAFIRTSVLPHLPYTRYYNSEKMIAIL